MAEWQKYLLLFSWGLLTVLIGISWLTRSKKITGKMGVIRIALMSSVIALFPSIGGGIAFAGAWVGILQMRADRSNESVFKTASDHYDELLFIIGMAPVIGALGLIYMFIYFGWNTSEGEEKD